MNLYQTTVPSLSNMVRNLGVLLDKGAEHAKAKNFDMQVLLNARLAPDQYPLLRQVQAACDAAKFVGARLASKEPPKNPDTETTHEELRARIASTLAFLETITAKDCEGAETRMTPLPFMPGKGMMVPDYVSQLGVPNFYFHLTTAYAILRHNGVALGKTDFITGLTLHDV